MFRNKSVSSHSFAMVPRADIPRSAFKMQKAVKTTFDSGYLIPILCEEVLPGDTFNVRLSAFCRTATPLFPVLDNAYMETFFFFVPNRLTWDNWQKFCGEQTNPDDSTDYLIPVIESAEGGYAAESIFDQFGLPTADLTQIGATATYEHSALPFRAYNLIYNEWFRDQNLQDSEVVETDDGPDEFGIYNLLRRGKRHDYFTSCLPFMQKGESVPMPLGGTAPVFGLGAAGYPQAISVMDGQPGGTTNRALQITDTNTGINLSSAATSTGSLTFSAGAQPLYADLTEATAATINQLRTSFQIQKLLERDARGGTRYTEIVRAHFGVISPDARLQRPEYLGGGVTRININPVPQTSATQTDGEGTTTPQGNLAAIGTALMQNNGFTQSFTEHGFIIGLCNVRADLTYQQGLRRMWSRRTRFDHYWPAFATLGEQAVLNKEIYLTGDPLLDDAVFGYQERWAEYRYNPSEIRGQFRSGFAQTLDAWHYAQYFESAPALNGGFIQEDPPIARSQAVQEEPQFLADLFFDMKVVRPMPMYSVPGLIDHF